MIIPLILLCCLPVLFACAGKYLVSADPLENADVIAVLSGSDENRIRETASLYHRGIAYNILLTKTAQTFGDYDLPYNTLQIEMLEELGVPRGAIYLSEITAKNTGQEASGIINRMYDLGFHSVLIVTDAWHTRRVRTIFSDSFSNTPFTVRIYAVPDSGYNKYFWWLSADGWRHTVSEYVRILGYLYKRESNIPDYPSFFHD